MVRQDFWKGPIVQVDQIVSELLARGDINDETTLELNRMLEDWRQNKLDPGDADYLTALHARLTSITPNADEPAAAVAVNRIDGLSIEEWRDRALKAESELAQIEEAARNG
jgi:hypothetical protein